MEEQDTTKILYNILSEFLECAVVVGYDMEGNRVVINHWRDESTLQPDALATALKETLKDFKRPKKVIPVEPLDDDDDDQFLGLLYNK